MASFSPATTAQPPSPPPPPHPPNEPATPRPKLFSAASHPSSSSPFSRRSKDTGDDNKSRYGRYEPFQEFSNLSSSGHASIGHRTFHAGSRKRITIDCEFLFRRSQWGVLGSEETKCPAGIIYLNLHFGAPQGCRVRSATVTVTLDEKDPVLGSVLEQTGGRRSYRQRSRHPSGCPVQITPWFGPKQLGGETKSASIRSTRKAVPEVNVLNNGAGGVGYERSKSFMRQARWSFNGQRLPEKNSWVYRTIQWELSENELERQSFHSTTVRTGFAFEHSGQPFFMKVDIQGKLENWHDRVRSRFSFGGGGSGGSRGGSKENRVTTLLDFEDYRIYDKRLDELARGLPRAMEMENMQEVPIVIPDAFPDTSFQPEGRLSSDAEGEAKKDEEPAILSGKVESQPGTGQPLVENANERLQLLPSQVDPLLSGASDGGLTAQDVRNIITMIRQHSNTPGHAMSSWADVPSEANYASSTFVESDQGTVASEETVTGTKPPAGCVSETEQDVKGTAGALNKIPAPEKERKRQDEVDAAELLSIPFVLAILQLLSSLMNTLGYLPAKAKRPSIIGSQDEGQEQQEEDGSLEEVVS